MANHVRTVVVAVVVAARLQTVLSATLTLQIGRTGGGGCQQLIGVRRVVTFATHGGSGGRTTQQLIDGRTCSRENG